MHDPDSTTNNGRGPGGRQTSARLLVAAAVLMTACADSSTVGDAPAASPATTSSTIALVLPTASLAIDPTTTSSSLPTTTLPEPPTTTAAPTTTTLPPNPSGFSMPTTDLETLRLVFVDDLSGYGNIPLGSFPAATGGRWGGYGPGLEDTTGFGRYDMERTISVVDGVLDIWLHTDGGVPYVAAPWPILPDSGTSSLSYGRIEFAFRSEPVEGYKTAWLLWPDSGRGIRDGEIDFPEGDLDGVDAISGFMHRQNARRAGDQDVRRDGVYANNVWHQAAIVWLPNQCEFWLDGVQLGTTIVDRVPNTPMHWVFQTETRLDFSNPPPEASQGHVQLDWVVMWQYDPTVHVG